MAGGPREILSPGAEYLASLESFEISYPKSKLAHLLAEKMKKQADKWEKADEKQKGNINFNFHDDPEIIEAAEGEILVDKKRVEDIFHAFIWNVVASFRQYVISKTKGPRGMGIEVIPSSLQIERGGWLNPVERFRANLEIRAKDKKTDVSDITDKVSQKTHHLLN